MTRLPRLKGKELIRVLQKCGFGVVRVRGSHFLLRHQDARVTTVPVHSGEVLGPGLLRSILRDSRVDGGGPEQMGLTQCQVRTRLMVCTSTPPISLQYFHDRSPHYCRPLLPLPPDRWHGKI